VSEEFGQVWSATRARGTSIQLEEWLGFAQACCDLADEIAVHHFRRDLEIETKPDRTLVTAVDKQIEELIRSRVGERFPDHGLIGEEYGEAMMDASARWYIDPIDGTHNFIRGIPLFGTLLALEVDGELQVGVMSAPALRERWYASRGGGAWAVGAAGAEGPRPIRVSRVAAIDDAQLLYGSAAELEVSGRAPGFRPLLAKVWRERGFGDFWGYALVAEGAAEGMVEVGVSTWDLAAPCIIIEEAGGKVTSFEGERSIAGGSVLATNGILHDELLRRLQEVSVG
jgi:histidinol-phosphatase